MECAARSWTSGCPQIVTIRPPQEDRRECPGLRQADHRAPGGRSLQRLHLRRPKIWPRIKAVAEANNCVAHMLEVLNTARRAKLRVFYAMHHRYRPGDYETWKYIAPIQKGAWQNRTFEFGTWGGEFRAEFLPAPGEIVAQEHWCSSGFANTDLDLQLKKHGIHKLIVIGLIAHTCIEATVR